MRAVGLKVLKNRLSEYVRLDALHLASIEFLRAHGQVVTLASYDDRLTTAARAMRIPTYQL